ncbi:hypothetical protein BX264_6426 [Streptomyces sp. 2333.5]|nr:hypothetical protein BX264_6426 [Streptomyces sp. 2333.5]SEE87545.1 hypothetical protein SAMN05428943_6525 [Streptomyces sp. 2314.4]SEF05439.1 hypothetical protein SAMN05428942_6523 [Streptomyces sp. 2112.2]SOE09654.1 hypothetical protein SAMN06272775_0730 [Streptomyces sp. 2323.1]
MGLGSGARKYVASPCVCGYRHTLMLFALLVLSCLAQFNRYVASDPRKNLVDLVSNPLKE